MKTALCILGWLVGVSLNGVAFADEVPSAGAPAVAVALAPLPLEQMRAAIYTKEFARRFALPDPAPGTEPLDGIQANDREWRIVA